MKSSWTSVLLSCLCVALCYGQRAATQTKPKSSKTGPTLNENGTYTTRYDNINLDEILSSPRLVKSYINCLLTGKACTPEGNELKNILPDALATSCSKCTPKQKEGAVKVITTLQKNYPEDWKKLSAKWDPTGEYFKKITATLPN